MTRPFYDDKKEENGMNNGKANLIFKKVNISSGFEIHYYTY